MGEEQCRGVPDANADQPHVCDTVIRPIVERLRAGSNCCLIASRPASIRTTDAIGLTIQEENSSEGGIITYLLEQVFSDKSAQAAPPEISISFLQSYGRKIFDLLGNPNQDMRRAGVSAGVVVGSAGEAASLLAHGAVARASRMPVPSAAAHTIFTLHYTPHASIDTWRLRVVELGSTAVPTGCTPAWSGYSSQDVLSHLLTTTAHNHDDALVTLLKEDLKSGWCISVLDSRDMSCHDVTQSARRAACGGESPLLPLPPPKSLGRERAEPATPLRLPRPSLSITSSRIPRSCLKSTRSLLPTPKNKYSAHTATEIKEECKKTIVARIPEFLSKQQAVAPFPAVTYFENTATPIHAAFPFTSATSASTTASVTPSSDTAASSPAIATKPSLATASAPTVFPSALTTTAPIMAAVFVAPFSTSTATSVPSPTATVAPSLATPSAPTPAAIPLNTGDAESTSKSFRRNTRYSSIPESTRTWTIPNEENRHLVATADWSEMCSEELWRVHKEMSHFRAEVHKLTQTIRAQDIVFKVPQLPIGQTHPKRKGTRKSSALNPDDDKENTQNYSTRRQSKLQPDDSLQRMFDSDRSPVNKRPVRRSLRIMASQDNFLNSDNKDSPKQSKKSGRSNRATLVTRTPLARLQKRNVRRQGQNEAST